VLPLIRRRLYDPLLHLLRYGATPEKLAWSLALGVVVGVNPLLGSTTLLAVAAASLFRLNLVASQLSNHLVYPLELLLFPVFIRLGNALFRTPGLPLSLTAVAEAVRHHPWQTTRLLWRWEWHALVAWFVFACVAAPLIRWLLCPVLRKMLTRLQKQRSVEK
jgi:uncharacterized protein (DUF2062 family)